MLAEEKKFLSIPKAIGLFLIFHALFYRNQSSHFTPTNPLESFAQASNEVSFYTFLVIGIILCYKFNKVLCVGHNPAFTEVSNLLGYRKLIHLPTAGWIKFKFNESDWKHVKNGEVVIGLPKKY